MEDARYVRGTDRYNGTISTCELGSCKLKFPKYLESNNKKAYSFVEKEDYGTKNNASYIDLGIVHYEAITVKKVAVNTPPSYKLSFVVKSGMMEPVVVRIFENKVKADDYAIELQLKNLHNYYFVAKEYVLVKGKSKVTELKTEKKIYKSKPNLKPMKNRKVLEIHRYLFYGWASN